MIHNNVPNSDSQKQPQHNSIAVQKVDELVSNAIATAANKTKVKSLKTNRQIESYMMVLKSAFSVNLPHGAAVKLKTPFLKLIDVITEALNELPRPIDDIPNSLNLQWEKYKTTNEYWLMINTIVDISHAYYPKEHFFDKGITKSPVELTFDDFCLPEGETPATPTAVNIKAVKEGETVKEAGTTGNAEPTPEVHVTPRRSGETAGVWGTYGTYTDPGSDSSYVYDDNYKSKFLSLLLIAIESLNSRVYAQARELVSPFKLHPTHEQVIIKLLELVQSPRQQQSQQQPFTSFAQIPSQLQLSASTAAALVGYNSLVKEFTAPRNVIIKDQIAKALEVYWLTYLNHLETGIDTGPSAAQQYMHQQAQAHAANFYKAGR